MTIKIVLSSPLRTLPQSLRDSSLPEGAFEKFSAICLFSSFVLQGRPRVAPTMYGVVWYSATMFVPAVDLSAVLTRSINDYQLISVVNGAFDLQQSPILGDGGEGDGQAFLFSSPIKAHFPARGVFGEGS